MASSGPEKLALLLVGRTGNGKSSIGNSILAKKTFTPRGSTAAVTAEILKGEAVINGQEITVVDGPGIGDASFDNQEDIQATLNQVNEVFKLSPDGFSALLIVLKYGIRFTQQEKDAITMIKSIFGPDVVRKYGVIVMSHGDSFELDMEEEETSFEDWCKQQTGDIKALFTECDNRYVLFNNRAKDQEKLKARNNLMSKVTSIYSQVKNYTHEDYKAAEKERTKLLVKSKLPQMEKETEKVLGEINDQLNELGNNYSKEESLEMLNACKDKICELKTDLQNKDEGTECTKELLTRVALTETTIQMKLKRIQTQKPQHAEVGKNQSGDSGMFSSLSRAVSRGISSAVEKISPYVRYAIGVVTEEVPDNPLTDKDQSAVSKDQQQG